MTGGAGAGILGLHDQLNLSVVTMLFPLTLLVVRSLRQRRLCNAVELGRHLAKIEQRVCQIAGEQLLLHETNLMKRRYSKRKGYLGVLLVVVEVAIYLGLTYFLFNDLDVSVKSRWGHASLAQQLVCIACFALPTYFFVHYAIHKFRLQTKRP